LMKEESIGESLILGFEKPDGLKVSLSTLGDTDSLKDKCSLFYA